MADRRGLPEGAGEAVEHGLPATALPAGAAGVHLRSVQLIQLCICMHCTAATPLDELAGPKLATKGSQAMGPALFCWAVVGLLGATSLSGPHHGQLRPIFDKNRCNNQPVKATFSH